MVINEKTLVDRLAGSMALLGGFVPALMTFRNVQEHLGYGMVEAIVIAAVVEGIGFVTITTALDAWRAYQDSEDRIATTDSSRSNSASIPLVVSLIGVIVYLLVVISINAILDDGNIWQKIPQGMMSMFGMLGGLTVAVRNQMDKHAQAVAQEAAAQKAREQQALDDARAEKYRQTAREEERERAKMKLEHEANMAKIAEDARVKIAKFEAKKVEKVSETFSTSRKSFQKVPETFGKWKDWRKLPESEKKVIATLESVEEVSEKYGVTLKTAGNWLTSAKRGGKNEL